MMMEKIDIEKILWWVISIILAIVWFGPFFGIGDWGGRSSAGCFEDEPDIWICERP